MSGKTRPCEICGKPIDPERIEALPETRFCTEHARQIQRFGGEFRLTTAHERTSKPGSLKRNYGGVDIHKARNNRAIRRLRAEYEQGQEDGSPPANG